VIFLLLFLGLGVLLWAGTSVVQSYIYTEPVPGLYWRAAAAAGILALFLTLWCVLNYYNPGDYDTLFSFSSEQDAGTFDEFSAKKKLKNGKWGPEIHFSRKRTGRFQDPANRDWSPNDSEGIMGLMIIPLGGERVEFTPELDDKGNFRHEAGESFVRYTEVDGGRFFRSDQMGTVSVYRTGLFYANFLLNLLHLGLWFACLWLLLQFQWTHALGLGLVMWVALSIPGSIVSMLLATTTEAARDERPTASAYMAPPVGSWIRRNSAVQARLLAESDYGRNRIAPNARMWGPTRSSLFGYLPHEVQQNGPCGIVGRTEQVVGAHVVAALKELGYSVPLGISDRSAEALRCLV
jgi:hypothetical protein